MTTIAQLKKLEKYISIYGDDRLIASSLSKIVDFKIQQNEKLLQDLRNDLIFFEKKYDKKSAEFYHSFKKGELGDEMDFVEWSSLYDMYQRIDEKKRMLESGEETN